MTRRRWSVFHVACTCVIVTLSVSCDRAVGRGTEVTTGTTAAAIESPQVRPVVLPDLNATADAVRRQIQDAYGVTAKLQESSAPRADLAVAYGQLGMLLMAAEMMHSAEQCFLNASALVPNDIRWPYYLGHLHRRKGDLSSAVGDFERVIQLEPMNVPALVWLADMYRNEGRLDDAEKALRRGLTIDAHNVGVLAGLGRTALARHDYPAAVEYLERALAVDRTASSLHYPLALAYRGFGDIQNAEVHLRARGDGEESMADPLMEQLAGSLASGMSYETRGRDALARGDWNAAVAAFRTGISLAGNTPQLQSVLHQQLGTALYQQGDSRGALDEFQQAVRWLPQSAKAHYSIGVLMESAGQHQQAIEHLTTAVKSDPSYVEAHLQLARALQRSGRLAEAERQYAEAAAIDPRTAVTK